MFENKLNEVHSTNYAEQLYLLINYYEHIKMITNTERILCTSILSHLYQALEEVLEFEDVFETHSDHLHSNHKFN